MKQQAGDAGIELFVSIPIHASDPLFLRALHRRKGEDFRSIKRRARSDMAMAEVALEAKSVGGGGRRGKRMVLPETDGDGVSAQKTYTQLYKNAACNIHQESVSSSSSSSSTSDLFIINEKEMDFADERSKPRFRLVTELY